MSGYNMQRRAKISMVTGMPAYAAAAIAEVMPGTTSKGMPF